MGGAQAPRHVERTLEYLDEFYDVINDPGKANREMARECRLFPRANGSRSTAG